MEIPTLKIEGTTNNCREIIQASPTHVQLNVLNDPSSDQKQDRDYSYINDTRWETIGRSELSINETIAVESFSAQYKEVEDKTFDMGEHHCFGKQIGQLLMGTMVEDNILDVIFEIIRIDSVAQGYVAHRNKFMPIVALLMLKEDVEKATSYHKNKMVDYVKEFFKTYSNRFDIMKWETRVCE